VAGVAFVLLPSIAFIAASVKRQSQTFLYSEAAFLLFVITYVNYEHFTDRIGMPIALLIAGVVLIGLGLGTGRLSKCIRAPQ
jgi:ABC-type polysaccharide/polyol phosphate export permease